MALPVPARKIWVFNSHWLRFWKTPVIGKRETFLFDFEVLTAWNNLERDRIPAGLARDWGLKGVKLANSELHQSGTKCGDNKQNYCSNIDIHVQSDCNQFESGQRWQFWKRILVFSILVMLSTLISNTTKYHQQFIRKKRHCHPHNLGGDQGWTPRPAGNPPRGEGKGTLFSKICQHIWNSSSMSKISSLMLLMMMAIMLVIMLMIIMMLMIIIMVLLIMIKIKIMNVV